MPLSPGQTLNNRYRIVKLLGQGNFGAVYKAWDLSFESACAVKENLDTSPEAERQFKREAQLLYNLSHPNLPKVIDYFILPALGQYLVMEFVEGEDLQEKLERSTKPMPEDKVLAWAGQIIDALDYIHSQKQPIIHRDIKPANIKITTDGKAKLVDFGIAKVYDPNLMTTQGARAVTPGYSPPEQYGAGRTDIRTDIYALGATLYALLTAQELPESVAMMVKTAPRPASVASINPGVSAQTSRAIDKAIRLNAPARFQNMGEFRAALWPGDFHSWKTLQSFVQSRNIPTPFLLFGCSAIILIMALVVMPKLFRQRNGFSDVTPTEVGVANITTNTPPAFIEPTAKPVTETKLPTATYTQVPSATNTFTAEPSATPTATQIPTATPIVILDYLPTPNYGASMVKIPAGEFEMGGEVDDAVLSCQDYRKDCERGWYEHEAPPHIVYLDDFYMDINEVTNNQYTEFLNEMGNREEGGVTWLENDSSDVRIHFNDGAWTADAGFENHPVVEVSWYGAQAYCRWRGLRLPSEAQWEKAARGSLEGSAYPWGGEAPVCTPESINGAQFISCEVGTVPVGSFSPNGFDLYDMAGNVFEWVSDYYGDTYYQVSPRNNPQGPENGAYRVLRGGAWYDSSEVLRAAFRLGSLPTDRYYGWGLRCAYSPLADMVVQMVFIPAGEFQMGSQEGENDERPLHTVFLDDFYLDVYEVTNTQYAGFLNQMGNQEEGGVTWLEDNSSDVHIHQNGGIWLADEGYGNHPVTRVSWYGAQAYCQWRGARLPSEAEWEKAARGMGSYIYPWGDVIDETRANFCDANCEYAWAESDLDDGFARTAPVGSFPNGISPFGGYDMAGNVWEWVLDWYSEKYYNGSPTENPYGPDNGQYRVRRGGSWDNPTDSLRVTIRDGFYPTDRGNFLGFRCARSAE